MLGYWLRVTPGELERAAGDLTWAFALAEQVSETEYAAPPTPQRRRLLELDKTWHGLDFLLRRRNFPVSVVLGEQDFLFDPDDIPDWGYGPPRYLTPEQVAQAAQAIAALTEADLIAGVDPAHLDRERICPAVWDRSGELEWAVSRLPRATEFLTAAAADGDAVICWIA
ncbi:hypothetical protein BG844_27035 [Couchioplanes caeruleus subsp. caeruleus]|uniref:DUF1877 domain-containing protein n=2 Tax=Couchioplanes caeruleus TaxID=56438 RepID=A0A1K0FF05_9ACTN|nr:hypothetical protein BG844_27035 [Couchioplanes caeruleus subsp. caeruleus]